MCGLSGFWEAPGAERATLERIALAMADALAHRGPDDRGAWASPEHGLAFGHRRLAILDLTAEGHQPMVSPDGRFALTYNGEIYNYRKLVPELERAGWRFRSTGDTEVVLAAAATWGLPAALERMIGMFALAWFDRREECLVLARDRLGIKPLYWSDRGGLFAFGSELAALRAHPRFRAELDRDSVALFLRHGHVPDPFAILAGVRKLPPGGLLVSRGPGRIEERRWWDALEVARAAAAAPLALDTREADDAVDAAVATAVGDRRLADVPLGAFLSGGIDSSLVVAHLQAQSSSPVETFTIGFGEAGYDEAPHARAVAQALGTRHHELVVDARAAMELVPRLPELFDEPFGDASALPTVLVSRLAREHVTVVLSGDGGDELFGGYARYFRAERLWNSLRRVPGPVRSLAAAGLSAVGERAWDVALRPVRSLLPRDRHTRRPGVLAHKLARTLRLGDERAFYRQFVSHWSEPARLVAGAREPETPLWRADTRGFARFLERMLVLDTLSYLPGDILTKVDRASMAVGLEARVPLLDPRLFELAWRLPAGVRIGPPPGKALLRRLVARRLPRALVERPKQGFSVPIGAWLRGPLREWAEALLAPERLARGGVLEPAPIRKRFEEHLAGRAEEGPRLWDVLVLQAWRERYGC